MAIGGGGVAGPARARGGMRQQVVQNQVQMNVVEEERIEYQPTTVIHPPRSNLQMASSPFLSYISNFEKVLPKCLKSVILINL